MAAHSSILAWRIPGTGAWWLPSMGSHRVGHNWCDLAAAAARTSKVMLKILQVRLQQSMNLNFQMFKLVLEKAEEPEIKQAASVGSSKKTRVPEKHLFLRYWLCQSIWLCGLLETVESSERDENTRPPDLPPEKSVCRSRSNSYNCTWNRLVPNWERSTSRLCIVTQFI